MRDTPFLNELTRYLAPQRPEWAAPLRLVGYRALPDFKARLLFVQPEPATLPWFLLDLGAVKREPYMGTYPLLAVAAPHTSFWHGLDGYKRLYVQLPQGWVPHPFACRLELDRNLYKPAYIATLLGVQP